MVSYEQLRKMLLMGAKEVKRNEENLCKLDSYIGDGDHGVGMAKIAVIIQQCCENCHEPCPGKLMEEIGNNVTTKVGGSSGMLWGTFFGGMSLDKSERETMNREYFIRMFRNGFEDLMETSGAELGDKTMMDAMIPAYKAFEKDKEEEIIILQAAAKAAKDGAEKTAEYVARFGRAKNLKERAVGYKDAGAVSAAMMIGAWAKALEV